MRSTHAQHLSPQSAKRLQGGELMERGFDNDEIAEILEVGLRTVARWRKRFQNGGFPALVRKHQSARPQKLDDAKRQELKDILLQGARAAGYPNDRWTAPTAVKRAASGGRPAKHRFFGRHQGVTIIRAWVS